MFRWRPLSVPASPLVVRLVLLLLQRCDASEPGFLPLNQDSTRIFFCPFDSRASLLRAIFFRDSTILPLYPCSSFQKSLKMMEMSYDAGNGGWGEHNASQTTSAPAQTKQNALERLPACVTVADLAAIPEGEEHVSMGGLSFTTVRVAGTVSSVTATEDNGQSLEYVLKDSRDPSAEFTVINYVGLSPEAARGSHQFSEGTKVHAVGKLRSFSGRLVIVAFQVRELEQEDEMECFELEAKIGRHFFEKYLYEIQPGQDLSLYDNTMLSTHIRSRPGAAPSGGFGGAPTTPGPAQPSFFSKPTPTPATGGPAAKRPRPSGPETMTDAENKGLRGQRARIFQFIVDNSQPEVGVYVGDVKRALGLEIDPKFDDDLAHLVDEGIIYSTHDDEHYAPI
uniref:RPA_C domain-containing protein n=1 Tax=Steinernema glaseri TaxID=37863 RepID=A0A1I7ZGX3_9BILA